MAETAEKIKVLLVVDEAEFSQALARCLERRGFAIGLAGNGAEALEILADDPAAVVVSDVKMPGMDGLELLQRIRDEHPETEVILLTGQASVDDGVTGLKADAFDYLAKPVATDHLAGKPRQAAELARSRRQMAERLASLGILTKIQDQLDRVREVTHRLLALPGAWSRAWTQWRSTKYWKRPSPTWRKKLSLEA